jgi:hypothetical protein
MIIKSNYNKILDKYDHEIKFQRELCGDLKKETMKEDDEYNYELYKYGERVFKEYSEKMWFLFHWDLEQLEKGK